MIGALLLFAQAAAGAPVEPSAPPSCVGYNLPGQTPAKTPAEGADETIIVKARQGEHPARLGKPLPEVAGPLLPKAVLDLGDGVTLASEARTHAREGGAEAHLSLTVPF